MDSLRKYENNEKAKPRRTLGLALLTGSFLGIWLALSGFGMAQVTISGINRGGTLKFTTNAQYVDVAAGLDHSLALGSDGTVVAWGNNDTGQCNVPTLPPGLTYVEISAGGTYDDGYSISFGLSVARRSDGSVVAWGDNSFGQLDVPPLPSGLSYVEIAAGNVHALARLSDGSVVAWGDNSYGQCNVPALTPGLSYVEISAGGWIEDLYIFGSGWPQHFAWHRGHSVARCSDGSVVVWGDNTLGQQSVPALPPGVTYVEVAAGSDHTVARLSNGSLVAWGDNSYGQCDVTTTPPLGLAYDAIDAGGGHTMARLSDGWLVGWGNAPFAGVAPALPAGMTYTAMVVGGGSDRWTETNGILPPESGAYAYSHTLALRSDGCVLGWGSNWYGQANQPPAKP